MTKNRKKRKIGIWSSRKALQGGDGRSAGVRYYEDVRKALILELGGDISIQKHILVDDVAFLELKIRMMKEEYLGNKESSTDMDKYFLAWVNTQRRCLEAIGLKTVPKDLEDVFSYSNKKFWDNEQ